MPISSEDCAHQDSSTRPASSRRCAVVGHAVAGGASRDTTVDHEMERGALLRRSVNEESGVEALRRHAVVGTKVEYQDFAPGEAARESHLRVRRGTQLHHFTVPIPNEAFLSGRVRNQDAPDICYLTIRGEIAACGDDGLPARALRMTDQELEEYRVAHSPRTPSRRQWRWTPRLLPGSRLRIVADKRQSAMLA
jgi:hypothetical protein